MKNKLETMKASAAKKAKSFGVFLNKNASFFAVCLVVGVMIGSEVSAAGNTADTLWKTLSGEIEKWCKRLGGAVMLIGGIIFGTGWQSEDPSRKTTGINTIIAGGIILAVAALTSTFFA